MNKISGLLLVGLAILVSVTFIVVAAYRELSALENTLLQVFSLGVGLIGSYILGQESARDAGREMMKPHAKSAFRRLLSLTQSLSRLAQTMAEIRPRNEASSQAAVLLDRLEGIVVEQIAQAADALEDWKDVLPDEFKAVEANPLGVPQQMNQS
ncbi:hypothetical protein [Bordetella bronchiseptica]|uniref:hypothetical protein n=1 Tax=Bordetella bronchiseptica TaxID=518 RepID=UPI00128EFF81|nr:hypothetical protein [Bordetella bronchiseptica]